MDRVPAMGGEGFFLDLNVLVQRSAFFKFDLIRRGIVETETEKVIEQKKAFEGCWWRAANSERVGANVLGNEVSVAMARPRPSGRGRENRNRVASKNETETGRDER